MRLTDKIVLVTGAAQGIGKSIAELFCENGATVILSDINDDLGRKTTTVLGDKAEYIHLDVGIEDDCKYVEDFILNKHKKLDVLINNAGITGFLEEIGPFDAENSDLATWEKVHKVNSTGVMLGCKSAIKLMKESGGSIINISSRSGIVGIPTAVAYASSKASVRNHTKSVALYCANKNYNIRCNSIHPAAIMTPMWDYMLGEGDYRKKMIDSIESGIPMGHFGEPKDVAFGALYLASDESKYVTGIELLLTEVFWQEAKRNPNNK